MQPTNREIFSEALRRINGLGWKAIPVVVYKSIDKSGEVKREKSPLVDWKQFQDRAPTKAEIDRWCASTYADFAGVEIVTGRYSPSLVVTGVDFDQRDGRPNFFPYVEDLVDAMHTKTASGGYHYYFKHDTALKNATNIFDGDKNSDETIVDFRGEGGVIVVGPTPLWSSDPRSDSAEKPVLVSRYETKFTGGPEELLPLPARFIVALQTKRKVGNESWREVFNGKVKDGNKHTVALSLIAKLLNGVTEPEHVAGVRDLVYAVLKTQFAVDPNDPVEREKIEDMFEWVWEKEKKKRSPEYQIARRHISAAEDVKAKGTWDELLRPVRAELRGDLVTFFAKDGEAMRLPSEAYFSPKAFRRAHALEYGVLLPSISAKRFEELITSIPVVKIQGQAISLEEITQEILERWVVAKEPCADEESARRVASKSGYAMFEHEGRQVLLFSYKKLLGELQDEGLRPGRPEMSDAFRAIGLASVRNKSSRLWKYDTKPVEVGPTRETVQ